MMMPTEPTDPKRVSVGGIEATPLDTRPQPQLGESATLNLLLRDNASINVSRRGRYYQLLVYGRYAGEADYGKLLGGVPYLRERPLPQWDVESHVVPIVFGAESSDRSFWALVTGVSDNSTFVSGVTGGGDGAYGVEPYGSTYGIAPIDQNIYRVDLDVVNLALIDDYPNRQALLDDLSQQTSQL